MKEMLLWGVIVLYPVVFVACFRYIIRSSTYVGPGAMEKSMRDELVKQNKILKEQNELIKQLVSTSEPVSESTCDEELDIEKWLEFR